MKVSIRGGLLYRGRDVIGLPTADWIAQANGFMYVERMVKAWDGTNIEIDDDTKKVTSPTTPCERCKSSERIGQDPTGGPCRICMGSGKTILKEA